MLHINRVTLLGRAGRDPEIRTMKSGDKVASFSLATSRRWKGQDGQPAEATEWHRIAVFGSAVRVVEEMVRKGAPRHCQTNQAGPEEPAIKAYQAAS